MIIAFTGVLENARGEKRIAGAGKDEAAAVLVKNGFVSVAFADIMKRFCVEVLGFTVEQCWGASEERAKPDKRYPRKELLSIAAFEDAEFLAHIELVASGRLMTEDEKRREFRTEYLTVRYALQKLGDWGRDCFADVWANKALAIAKELLVPHKSPVRGDTWCVYDRTAGILPNRFTGKEPRGAVIPDCRFQNEFRHVKEEGGYIIRVKRLVDEFPSKLDDSHVSERDILEWGDAKFDHVIDNNGTVEELHAKVLSAVEDEDGRD